MGVGEVEMAVVAEVLDDCGGGGGVSSEDMVTQDYTRVRQGVCRVDYRP